MKLPFIILFSLCCLRVMAQSSAEIELENIVPNPGFERFDATPIGWFYKGLHFTRVMKYWSSPTSASPDIFGPGIRVPDHWAEKGFGDYSPHAGSSWVGLTLYGCKDGKPHCREYIQIQLKEPLVVGQNYYVEFWVGHLPRSYEIDKIGAYFSKEMVELKTDELLSFEPQVASKKIISVKSKQWTRISGYFTAEYEADYLILGNFFRDDQTNIKSSAADYLPYSYYYVDDVLVRKEEPILEVPLSEDDLSFVILEEGKIFELKNIYFDYDKWELLPRSYIELNKLLQIMLENPNMTIEVIGHTDSMGSYNYNLYLSRKRARAVVEFLNENGITKERTTYSGKGKSLPVASNTTGAGRQLNRRVEFLVLKL